MAEVKLEEKMQSLEDLLRQDHDEIDGYWEEAEQRRAAGDATALDFYRKFTLALDEHIEVEEEIVFPYSVKTREQESRHIIDIMRAEHVEIRKLLGKINAAISAAKLPSEEDETELKNVLGAHNTREEGLYYPDFDAAFSKTPEGQEMLHKVRSLCHCGHR
ncbi:MAG: hemerythrin domain-containing protein [Candidatus Thermoplasmatota archaeon]|nr:hemerythrin domain-containing protein [Candidatus Thermoplasmatota archaeon]MCL5984182.1 hemerythrin domain-containing protein [Candidatus Thermoplasmatota archaeon]